MRGNVENLISLALRRQRSQVRILSGAPMDRKSLATTPGPAIGFEYLSPAQIVNPDRLGLAFDLDRRKRAELEAFRFGDVLADVC